MQGFRQLIDDIRSFLSSELAQDPDAVRSLHAQYLKAVALVNRRLRECDELLQQGHRAQAIQMAESEPKLLDLVAQLDFPEREEWNEVANRFGLPVAPAVVIDIASDLNEAYIPKVPLERFIRFNRLHALAYSPLKTRIQLLRRIAKLDPRNPIWDGDVRTFEKARHTQIHSELQSAAEQRDIATAIAIGDELNSPAWRESPPPKLKQRATEIVRKIQSELARRQLRSVETDLCNAWRANQLERARALRVEWKLAAGEVARDFPDEEVADAVLPALQWLAQEDKHLSDQFEAAVQALDALLLKEGPRHEIEQAYQSVLAFQREIPADLDRRVSKRLNNSDRSKVQHALRKIAGILGTMSVIIVSIASFR